MMIDESKVKSLSTVEKMIHQKWNIRLDGYAEAISDICSDGNCNIFDKYSNLIIQLPNDNNVKALDKALDLILLFVDRYKVTDMFVDTISKNIIMNCVGNVRQNIKEKGSRVLKMLIEVGFTDIVIKELLKNVECKLPNVIIGCITVLRESLRDFGTTVVSIKECLKIAIPLLEYRDSIVRKCGKELAIEICQWTGKQSLLSQLNSLKPLVLNDLEIEFDKISTIKTVPIRFLRSVNSKVSVSVKPCLGIMDEVSKGESVCDVMNPIEVLSKVPPEFYEKILNSKWTVRKEALEIIEKLTNYEKLMSGDYEELIKILLKVLSKDVNIVLVVLTLKILVQLSKGLGNKYSPYAFVTLQTCLEKFKEKKPIVVSSLVDCVDAIYKTTTLESICPAIVSALVHKNQTIKFQTALFLNRIFHKSSKTLFTSKILKQLIPNVVLLSFDNLLSVRQASFQVLGTAMKVVGENYINAFLDEIDNVKKTRIMEFYMKDDTDNVTQKCNTISNLKRVTVCEESSEVKYFTHTKSVFITSPFETLVNESNEVSDNVPKPQQNIYEDRVHDNNCVKMRVIETTDNGNDALVEPCQPLQPDTIPISEDFDRFKCIIKTIISEENDHVKNYKEHVDLSKRFERMYRHKCVFSQNNFKRSISLIITTDMKSSLSAIRALYATNILDDTMRLKEYGCLILVAVVKQLMTIIKQLSLLEGSVTESHSNVIQDILFIIKQVINQEGVISSADESIVFVVFVALRNLIICCQSKPLLMSFVKLITTLSSLIYHKISYLSRAKEFKYFAIAATTPSMIKKYGQLEEFDLHGLIEQLYDHYIMKNGNTMDTEIFTESSNDIVI